MGQKYRDILHFCVHKIPILQFDETTCEERIWSRQGRNVAKYDTSNQPLILPLKEFIALCYPHVSEIPTYLFMNDANSDIVCAN